MVNKGTVNQFRTTSEKSLKEIEQKPRGAFLVTIERRVRIRAADIKNGASCAEGSGLADESRSAEHVI